MIRPYLDFQRDRKLLLFGEDGSDWHFTEAYRSHQQKVIIPERQFFSTLPETFLKEGALLVFTDQPALDRFLQACLLSLARVIGLLRGIPGQGLVLTLDELELQLRGQLKSKGTAEQRFDSMLNCVDTKLVTDFGPPALVGANGAVDLRKLWAEDPNKFLFNALQRVHQGVQTHAMCLPGASETEAFETLTVHFAKHVIALGFEQDAPTFIGHFPALKGKTVVTGFMDSNRMFPEVPSHRKKQRRPAWKRPDFGSQMISMVFVERIPETFQMAARAMVDRVLPLDIVAAQ